VVFLRLSTALHPQGFFIGDPMKPQILTLKLGDFAPSSRTITPQGFLACTAAKLSKAPQVRQYYAAEFEGIEAYTPDQVINVYTSAEELFKPSVIKSLQGADVADYHPAGNEMNASTWRQHVIGTVSNVRQEGDYLLADLLIKDSRVIDEIQKNQRLELSLGYSADVVMESGVAPDGTPYQAKFINFIGDHVALVEYGRCGGSCRIGDQNPQPTNQPPKEQKMARLVVDGLPFDVAGDNPALEAALQNQAKKLADYQAAKKKTGLTAQVADLQVNQATPEKLEQMAAERTAVIADAKKLHPQVKTDGCSCEQIKREAVSVKAGDALAKAVLAGVAVADAKPEQIDTAFRALAAIATTAPSNPLGTALHGQTTQVGDGQPQGGQPTNQQPAAFDKSKAYQSLK
jgi:uncharacterized protein